LNFSINSGRDLSGGRYKTYKFKVKNEKLKVFDEIISLENLFLAWHEFRRGKKNKPDVQDFEFNLEDNLFQLHQELTVKTYHHFYL